MLEITVIHQLVTGELMESGMVATLLLANVALAAIQEGRANATLSLLRERLALRARVYRDGGPMF